MLDDTRSATPYVHGESATKTALLVCISIGTCAPAECRGTGGTGCCSSRPWPSYTATLLLLSHDRRLLDEVDVTHTVALG